MDISTINNIKYDIYQLGTQVRGSIDDTWTYRVRPGNGYYGAEIGALYQDKYPYFVPSSINNPESAPDRRNFATAVSYWKNTLTDEEKEEYNQRALEIGGLSGYNLFIKECMLGVYHMFVNRGQASSIDWNQNSFTYDSAWHDLDMSSKIPNTARAVLVNLWVKAPAGDFDFMFRTKGFTNFYNRQWLRKPSGVYYQSGAFILMPDSNGEIQYWFSYGGKDELQLQVCGWWT